MSEDNQSRTGSGDADRAGVRDRSWRAFRARALAALPAGLTRPARALLGPLEVLAWTAFFAFAAIFLSLRYWFLPHIEDYRENLVAAVSSAVGLPVRIGAITTDWQGLRPRIAIADVRVYDSEGREALVLPSVENVIAWRSLAVMELRLHSFLIDGPKLAVRRDAQGEVTVGGLRMSGGKGDGRAGDWVLSQSEILIRDGELEWVDELRGAAPLRLSSVNLRLENSGRRHAFGLRARPPAELGPGIELRAVLDGDSVRALGDWNGRIYAELGATDLAGWRAWVDYPIDVRRGEGALRLWATLKDGLPAQVTADVSLTNVSATLGRDLPALEIGAVRGRLYGRQTDGGYDFGVRQLALEVPRAPSMSATSFRASWQPARPGGAPGKAGARPGAEPVPQKGSLSADLIELAPLAHLAEYLPFPADLRKLLAELAPRGNLMDVRFDWSGELPDQASFTAKTRFSDLTMSAWRSIPGFANLSGTIDASEKKGVLSFNAKKPEVELPKVFPEPRTVLDTLTGEVAWDRGPGNAVQVRLSNLSFANEDLAGTAFGTYAWTGEGPGVVDLSASASRADALHLAHYLPLATLMGTQTREWVANAVKSGQASDVRFRLKGDLRDFPFVDPAKGIFSVSARIHKATLDYVPGWPRMEGVEADLLFEREKIRVVGRSATILGAKLSNVKVEVPSLLEHPARLLLEGIAEGPSADFLKYIQQTPVRRMVGGATDPMAASGRGRLRLKLELPLGEAARTRLAGEYQFTGNTLTVDARLPPLENAGGRLAFTDGGLTVQDVRAQLFGGDVRLQGGTRPDGSVLVQADGRATADGIRPVFDHPWRRRLTGASRYLATVSVKEGRTQVTVDSTLEGMASALPAPLAKAPAEILPLRVEVFPGDGRDRISVQVGPQSGRIVAAEFLRAGQGAAAQVQRSLITLNPPPGETPRVPERRGTTVRGSLPALDLDRWLPLFNEAAGPPVAGQGAGAGDGTSFDLRVGVLDALGKRMRGVTMLGVAEAIGWSANMTTAEFAGDLTFRTEGSGRLYARLSRFTLPEDAPGTRPGEGAKDLPAVDIIAESFVHRGKRLGRVEVAARHEGRDWRIDKLAMTNPDSSLTGTGLWKTSEGSRTSVNFKLEVSDVGNFLERFGYPNHIKGGKAKTDAALTWNGDPLNLDYATLGGTLQMQSDDGQFLEIEPGVGKLVALMSLQMLPRRLALDFRDVFSKGFKYDRITSSMAVERGVMQVKDFHMRGPAADVHMSGQVDLSLETQALEVKVIPQLGDTASTVVGLVNPVAGVATLLAGRLFKNPLGKIFAFDYKVTGTWADPKVDKVEAAVTPSQAQER